ncbi:MAG: reverse gyrase [Candidatus Aenigmarchaeota archaeon]|nr:reverse gyrase [Candidatus Aenigmarchaeota archaeon]MDW8160071.1 reverse gyrase [Candidatus Aenigmarchaeota archaeon]
MMLEYKGLCPNCGEDISSSRLELALPCEKCLPKIRGKMKEGKLTMIKNRNRIVEEIEKLFEKALKVKMWALQKFWVRRFLDGESFCLISPTGSGKTTVQIFLSLYSAEKMGKRCLILLPTSVLVHQVSEKMKNLKEKLGFNNTLISCYHSLLSEKEKEDQLNLMDRANIIITTHLSVMKRVEINKQKVDIVFVDDVDSFLKRSKSIWYVLEMMDLQKEIKEILKGVKENKIQIERALEEIEKYREKIKAQLIVSGATQKAKRTKALRLLTSIFNFSIGGRVEFGRNIVDCYLKPKKSLEEEVSELISKLGNGGLIFVPTDKGTDFVEKIEKHLVENGFKAKSFLKPKKEIFNKFERGELDVLIGMVTLRSPLVRGIDLPHRIKYAIFVGVPKFLIKIDPEEFHPTKWLMLLNNISSAIDETHKKEFDSLFSNLKKIKTLNRQQLEEVRNAIKSGKSLEGFLEFVRKTAIKGLEFFKKILKDEKTLQAIKNSETISFGLKDDKYYFIVTDEVAYLQASGRTSRLYVGGLTKGLSVVIIDDEKAFKNLVKELKYFEEIEWKSFEEIDLKSLREEIEKDRERVILAMNEKLETKEGISMKTILFIVESPNKARTIARYFGTPSKKTVLGLSVYEIFLNNNLAMITASGGHVTDLVVDEGLFGVKIENGFIPLFKAIKKCSLCGKEIEMDEKTCPSCNKSYFVDASTKIEALRILAGLVDEVIIGTDPDSEGEKIAYDLCLLIKPVNEKVKRIRFHEVTKKAILNSLSNLEDFNLNLVNSQIVRRIEDRWIGFSISPVLWKFFKSTNLSAGRVQTPVLGWVDERSKKMKEREELISLTLSNGLSLKFRGKIGTYKKIVSTGIVEIVKVEKFVGEINPFPPFTTDTLISSLSFVLKVDASQAMSIAQKLFENGLITYHRTSSTTVSNVGIAIAREYITSTFGENFVKERRWEMEGAHECIRPTRAIDTTKLKRMVSLGLMRFPSPLNEKDYIAYDLIFKRFMASQMKPVKVEKVLIKIIVADEEREFEFTTRILEDGFNKISKINTVEIPEVEKGKYSIKEIKKKIVKVYYPYTYSEIVSEMKKKGIGRPSTYAKILEVLKKRKYVIEIKKSRIIISPLGSTVYNFLKENYWKYLNEETTRRLENEMDEVEKGLVSAESIIKKFYAEISEIIRNAIEKEVKYPNQESLKFIINSN